MVTGQGTIVEPHYAGSFYPAGRQDLAQQLSELRSQVSKVQLDRPVRALVLPHAGYIYSGLTAAYGIAALQGQQFNTVVVMGPDHRVGLGRAAVSNAKQFRTPLGELAVSPLAQQLCQHHPELFAPHAMVDQLEHSVEVILPFLQDGLPPFDFLPMVIGQQEPEALARALLEFIGKETLLVASSDLSHFLDEKQARLKDEETLQAILAMDHQRLLINDNKACGLIPIRVLLYLAQQKNWQPQLLHYSTSADYSGDSGRVVGYGAIAFT